MMPNVMVGWFRRIQLHYPLSLSHEMGAGERNLSFVFTCLQMELSHHLNNRFMDKFPERLICHFLQKRCQPVVSYAIIHTFLD